MRKKTPTEVQLALLQQQDPEVSELQSWALVELFGHQRIVGFLSTQTIGNAALIRVDVPDLLKDGVVTRAGFTRYFGPAAIYSITPVDEATVRKMLPHVDGTPGAPRAYRMQNEY